MILKRIVYTPLPLCLLFFGLLGSMAIAEPEADVSGQVDASVNGAFGIEYRC